MQQELTIVLWNFQFYEQAHTRMYVYTGSRCKLSLTMGCGQNRLINTGLSGLSNAHLLDALDCCWKLQASSRINSLWNWIIYPQNTYPNSCQREGKLRTSRLV